MDDPSRRYSPASGVSVRNSEISRTEFQASTKESVVTWHTFIQAQPTVKDIAWPGTHDGKWLEKPWRTWCLPCGSVSKPCTPGEHQNSW